MDNLRLIGVLVTVLGLAIFLLGKKLFILRAYFGDRSMFSQLVVGTFLTIVGLICLFFSGALT